MKRFISLLSSLTYDYISLENRDVVALLLWVRLRYLFRFMYFLRITFGTDAAVIAKS